MHYCTACTKISPLSRQALPFCTKYDQVSREDQRLSQSTGVELIKSMRQHLESSPTSLTKYCTQYISRINDLNPLHLNSFLGITCSKGPARRTPFAPPRREKNSRYLYAARARSDLTVNFAPLRLVSSRLLCFAIFCSAFLISPCVLLFTIFLHFFLIIIIVFFTILS